MSMKELDTDTRPSENGLCELGRCTESGEQIRTVHPIRRLCWSAAAASVPIFISGFRQHVWV